MRGSRSSSERTAPARSPVSSPSASHERLGLGRELVAPGGRRSSASRTGASLTSALSPIRGIDAWPGPPRGREREAEHALLAGADAVVAGAPSNSNASPRALVHDHVAGARLSGCCSHSQLRAVLAPVSSSAVNTSSSSPASGRQPSSASAQRRRRLGGHLALHVERAAAPDAAVAQLARPRVHGPLLRIGQHGVHVAEEAQPRAVGARRAGAPPGWAGPSTAASSSTLEAGLLQQPLQELLRGLLVARRIDRVEPDQALEQLGRAALELRAIGHAIEYMEPHARP